MPSPCRNLLRIRLALHGGFSQTSRERPADMTNQFPIPPRMPRIVRIPAPAFLRRQSPAVRYMLMAAAAILLLGGLWAAWLFLVTSRSKTSVDD